MSKKTELSYDARLLRCAHLNVLEIADVVVMTNLSERYIRQMIADREIPHHINQRGRISFLKSDIENWLLGTRVATTEELNRAIRTR